jgi:apolipoprotein N-acyltransferase
MMKTVPALSLAGVSGALSVLGWAPFGWWYLSVLGYGLLFWLLSNSRTVLHAGLLGMTFGLGLHLVGHGWIMDSLHGKTGMGVIPAAFSTLIFLLYLALFSAIPCLLWRLIAKHNALAAFDDHAESGIANRAHLACIGGIAVFAALMTLAEWTRSLFFNGFTSLSLGYSLIPTWLAGYAPVAGLYGVSWIGFCISGLTALIITRRKDSGLLSTILLLAIAGVGLMFTSLDWVQPAGMPLNYRLIQSNIAQERKFDPLYMREHMQQLVETIEQQSGELIITPETAFPVFLNELPAAILPRLTRFSKDSGSHLFIGIATTAANGEGYNSVLQIAPDRTGVAQYNKVKLMPFGEYSPAGFGWFTSSLNVPLKDLTAGTTSQQPFIVGSQRIGTLICHEDLLGQELRRWLPAATVLINPSNLAWFEGSFAISQRLQIAQMRALESGRPILRATNTGITAHIDHRGQVVSRLPETQDLVLTGRVQPMQGQSPYSRWGNGPVIVGSCLLLIFSWLINARTRLRSRPPRTLRRNDTL